MGKRVASILSSLLTHSAFFFLHWCGLLRAIKDPSKTRIINKLLKTALEMHSWEKHLYLYVELNFRGGTCSVVCVEYPSPLWTNSSFILIKGSQKLCPIHLLYSLIELWSWMLTATTSYTCIALDASLQHWLWSFCKVQDTITKFSDCDTSGEVLERRIMPCKRHWRFDSYTCVFRLQKRLRCTGFTCA